MNGATKFNNGSHGSDHLGAVCLSKVTLDIAYLCTQVSAAADRAVRRAASRPCCMQMYTVSMTSWWPTTVTSLPHWPST